MSYLTLSTISLLTEFIINNNIHSGISRVKAITSTMTRVGTPQVGIVHTASIFMTPPFLQWMAPEVLREERYTEKADVFR